jgi:hypothetical protein
VNGGRWIPAGARITPADARQRFRQSLKFLAD